MAAIKNLPIEALAHYIDNFDHFTEDCLFTGNINKRKPNLTLSPDQRQILRGICEHKMVAARSGHGVGKTSGLAFTIIAFLATRPFAKVVCTGPKFDQLKNTLWSEIALWLGGSHIAVKRLFKWTAERIYYIKEPETWWAIITTAKERENLQGFHGQHLLYVVDEASGVHKEIFEVILGSLTEDDNRLLVTGNPTQTTGFFYDAFHSDSDLWHTLHFNSEKSPLVSQAYLDRMRRKYPRSSDVYRVRVLGEFPLGNPEAFIQLSQAEAARMRDIPPEGILEIGADIARYGNDLTSVCVRQGNHVFPLVLKGKLSILESTDLIIQTLRKYRRKLKYTGKVRIKVDDTGLGGGVVDLLRGNKEYGKDNIDIVPINFAGKGNKEYHGIISVMWGGLRDRIDSLDLPDDEHLIEEIATRRFRIDDSGRNQIEPKSNFKKDYGDSPDRADSLVLCIADAEKISEKLVISEYNQQDDIHKSSFVLDWRGIETDSYLHYGSLCQQRDLTLCHVCTVWDCMEGHLYVYDELRSPSPVPAFIVPVIKSIMRLDRYKTEAFLAHPSMFSNDPTEKTVPKQYSRHGLWLKNPLHYTEYGAIAMLAQLFKQGKITIHDKCGETSKEVATWSIERGKPEKAGYGFCCALCLIISEIEKKTGLFPIVKTYKPYSSKKAEESTPKYKIPGMI